MFDFSNQVVIVTGAAGNLGSAVVKAFRDSGGMMVLADRATDSLINTFPEMQDSEDHMLIQDIDLTDAEAVENMGKQVFARFGRIDVLVNTAGGYRGGTPVHESSLESWNFMLTINARTVLLTSRSVIPYMLKRGSGKIINIGARPGLKGGANQGFYSASKSAVLRLTESMAAELNTEGINVNAVIPGTIDTPQNRKTMPNADYSKWVQPEALVDVIQFLASEAARAIHGAAIPVYGLS